MAECLRDAALGEANQDKNVKYMPTPEQIKAACEKIREGRSELSRTKFRNEVHVDYEIPVVEDWRY
jgi:hypothetical protein